MAKDITMCAINYDVILNAPSSYRYVFPVHGGNELRGPGSKCTHTAHVSSPGRKACPEVSETHIPPSRLRLAFLQARKRCNQEDAHQQTQLQRRRRLQARQQPQLDHHQGKRQRHKLQNGGRFVLPAASEERRELDVETEHTPSRVQRRLRKRVLDAEAGSDSARMDDSGQETG